MKNILGYEKMSMSVASTLKCAIDKMLEVQECRDRGDDNLAEVKLDTVRGFMNVAKSQLENCKIANHGQLSPEHKADIAETIKEEWTFGRK